MEEWVNIIFIFLFFWVEKRVKIKGYHMPVENSSDKKSSLLYLLCHTKLNSLYIEMLNFAFIIVIMMTKSIPENKIKIQKIWMEHCLKSFSHHMSLEFSFCFSWVKKSTSIIL